jgi:hypothetical protein
MNPYSLFLSPYTFFLPFEHSQNRSVGTLELEISGISNFKKGIHGKLD